MGAIQTYATGAMTDPATVQAARLSIASSLAVALTESGAPADEIAAALDPDTRAALPVVLAAAHRDLALLDQSDPAFAQKEGMLVDQLTRSTVSVDPRMDPDRRADWVNVLMEDLMGEPIDLVLEAIPVVRRSTKYAGDILTGIIAYVAPRRARLELERDRCQSILDAAR